MTEEFRNLINQAVEERVDETFVNLYEENKKYLRIYERLVLESIKTFDFNKRDFNSDLLKDKIDLVGNTNDVSIRLDINKSKGFIHLGYLVDERYYEFENYKKPEYLENETYNKEYMDELLRDQGISVSFKKADKEETSFDVYIIGFDASILIEALVQVNQKRKVRKK